MLFSALKVGQRAKVVAIGPTTEAYRDTLCAMGIVPGAVLTVAHIAPFGDPIDIIVRGTHLCLRKREAEAIQVTLVKIAEALGE